MRILAKPKQPQSISNSTPGIPIPKKENKAVAIPTPLHRRNLLLVERLHLVPLDLQHCGVVEETGHLRPVGIGVCDWDGDVAGWEVVEGHCGLLAVFGVQCRL